MFAAQSNEISKVLLRGLIQSRLLLRFSSGNWETEVFAANSGCSSDYKKLKSLDRHGQFNVVVAMVVRRGGSLGAGIFSSLCLFLNLYIFSINSLCLTRYPARPPPNSTGVKLILESKVLCDLF